MKKYKYTILSFSSSWAGEIQQIQQSDWFRELVEFSNTDRYCGRNPSSWSISVHELAVIVNLSPVYLYSLLDGKESYCK